MTATLPARTRLVLWGRLMPAFFLMLVSAPLAPTSAAPQDATKSQETPAAQDAQQTDDPDQSPIRVVGRLPRCRIGPGDPLDSIDMAPAAAQERQQVIKRDPATGAFGIFPDDDPVTGPGVWQRAGTRMDQYVFRAPDDGNPLCIGARNGGPHGWGQLRQVVDAAPYRGKILRVTMWAASQKAGRVWFWVASGRRGKPQASRQADMATDTGSLEFRGTHPWTPVSLTMGPVRCDQEKVSFGVLLDGPGDLWIYKPQIEVIGQQSAGDAERDCRKLTERR
jgi:hypothetical protein